jgi:hypothetical protein
MAVMKPLLLPPSLELCHALWQEKQCINLAPEWVCKFNYETMCVLVLCLICLWQIKKMILNYCTVFIKSLKWLFAKKLPVYFYATCSSLTCPKNNTLKKFHA